jgi:YggT family protein
MLAQTLIFLITTLGDLLVIAFLLRFILQWLRAPARNQLSLFVAALTDFAVRPMRRVLPGLWGMDLSSLFLAWLTAALEMSLVLLLKGNALGAAPGTAIIVVALLGILSLIRLSLYIVMMAVVLQAILSWVNPDSPIAPLLNTVTRPVLRPFRRLVPPIANVDLSPLFLLITCQLILSVPLMWLEANVARLL